MPRNIFYLLLPLCLVIPAHASDEACKIFLDVARKLVDTPTHTYMVRVAGFHNNKPENMETVSVGGVRYLLVNGKWTRSKAKMSDDLKQQEDNFRTSKETCHYVRDEAVNGEAAAVYTGHNDLDPAKIDVTMWISKTRSLPLREEIDEDVGGGAAGKSHTTARFEYTNVHAPAGAQ